MKPFLWLTLLFCAARCFAMDITTLDGTFYRDVKVTRVDAAAEKPNTHHSLATLEAWRAGLAADCVRNAQIKRRGTESVRLQSVECGKVKCWCTE